jgi:predicted RNA methylase
VYELGSGDGEFILTAAREFGCKRAVGIEIDYTRHIISKVKKRISRAKNAEFKREDFKKVKLNDASVVYFYLVPKVIERILPKLKKELKPGTRIVSLKYKTALNLQKEDKENNLYSYIV